MEWIFHLLLCFQVLVKVISCRHVVSLKSEPNEILEQQEQISSWRSDVIYTAQLDKSISSYKDGRFDDNAANNEIPVLVNHFYYEGIPTTPKTTARPYRRGDKVTPPIPLPVVSRPFQISLLVILLTAAILANGSVILNISKDSLKLRMVHFLLIRHVCITDCIGALLVLPVPLISIAYGEWRFSDKMCSVISTSTAAVWTMHLVAVAFYRADRVLAVWLPTGHYPIVSVTTVNIFLVFVWIVAISGSYLATYTFGHAFQPALALCIPNVPLVFFVVLFSGYCIGLLALTTGYVLAFARRRHKKRKKKREAKKEAKIMHEKSNSEQFHQSNTENVRPKRFSILSYEKKDLVPQPTSKLNKHHRRVQSEDYNYDRSLPWRVHPEGLVPSTDNNNYANSLQSKPAKKRFHRRVWSESQATYAKEPIARLDMNPKGIGESNDSSSFFQESDGDHLVPEYDQLTSEDCSVDDLTKSGSQLNGSSSSVSNYGDENGPSADYNFDGSKTVIESPTSVEIIVEGHPKDKMSGYKNHKNVNYNLEPAVSIRNDNNDYNGNSHNKYNNNVQSPNNNFNISNNDENGHSTDANVNSINLENTIPLHAYSPPEGFKQDDDLISRIPSVAIEYRDTLDKHLNDDIIQNGFDETTNDVINAESRDKVTNDELSGSSSSNSSLEEEEAGEGNGMDGSFNDDSIIDSLQTSNMEKPRHRSSRSGGKRHHKVKRGLRGAHKRRVKHLPKGNKSGPAKQALASYAVTIGHLLLYLPAMFVIGLSGKTLPPGVALLCGLVVYCEFIVQPAALLLISPRLRGEVKSTITNKPC